MPEKLPDTKDAFNELHKVWCRELISQAGKDDCKISYGRAAKLINVYLKAVVLTPSNMGLEATKFIHPPIDRILIGELAKGGCREEEALSNLWRGHNRSWSNYSQTTYLQTIEKVRDTLPDGVPLWMIEKYWSPEGSNEAPCPPSSPMP